MTPRDTDGWANWPNKKPRRPATGPRRKQGRTPFGRTWWGRAWVDALEGRARLDPNRLPRGRTYARVGAVDDLDVDVGEVRAEVQGSRRRPYHVRVRVRPFGHQEWDAVFGALAERAGHAAALLDGELPPEIAEDVRSVGLDLLPGPGEIQTRCSCPDWAEPCKHSAAVCYLVADRLDEDPFDLFLLRGRSREALMAGVRSQRLGGVAPASPVTDGAGLTDGWPEDPGMPARLAWGRQVTAVPSLPAPPRRAGRPTVLATDPPEGSGIDPQALGVLATDAARRAWELVTGRQPETTSPSGGAERAVDGLSAASALDLSADEDCARLAAAALGEEGAAAGFELDVLARRAGIRTTELLRRGLAWRTGGREGLFVLHGTWQPGPELLRGGREALGPGTRASANRLTNGERQLRLGRDGRWYPYRKVRRSWEPDGDPIRADC